MADLHLGDAPTSVEHDPATDRRNARVGLVLFSLYTSAYAVFMVLCAFFPTIVQRKPVAGINVAILFGLVLIVAALLVALLYGWLCRKPAAPTTREPS
jgi:uncharacterized membrane protein (DUF485 family)